MAGPARARREVQALFERATKAQAEGRLDEAETLYRQLARKVPKAVEVHRRLAILLYERRRYAEAAQAAATGLASCPNDVRLLTFWGTALKKTGPLPEAEAILRQAWALDPAALDAGNNLANLLNDLGRYEEAEPIFRAVLTRDSRYNESIAGLAFALRKLGRYDEALPLQHELLARQPERPGAHLEVAMLHLTRGDLATGFKEYAWRLRMDDATPPRLAYPPWRGEPLRGRSILLWTEQGLGDTIQFARFVRPLADQGARVVLCCQPALVALLRSMPGPQTVCGRPEDAGPVDFQAPLMSLPELLGTSWETLPADVPYLSAQPERIERWRQVARLDHGFRIGVTWQGKPTAKIDIGRSYPLRMLEELAALPGVRLISLQKEHGLDQLGDLPPGMVVERLDAAFDTGPDAFLDTAAVMASLDLVVTSDTSIAHLAGALGRPTWLALQHAPDWRWLLGREDSPWYPGMRLFRQRARGDWVEVFQRMATTLAAELGRGRVPRPSPPAELLVPVSWGELLDKLTILEIKAQRITDAAKLANVAAERDALLAVRDRHPWASAEAWRLVDELRSVNEALWEIEDDIRDEERRERFGERFIMLARSVYRTNDRRAALKRELNRLLGSALVEEKSYQAY